MMHNPQRDTIPNHLVALEDEVAASFRDVCRLVSGEHYRWNLPDELEELHELALKEAGQVKGNADMANLAQRHHDEVQQVVDEVAALRKRAGAVAGAFRKRFEKVRASLDGEALSAAAIKVRGVLDCSHDRLARFVLHLLVTPGLLDGSRHALARLHQEDELSRGMSPRNVARDAAYWPRVDAMLDVVEELGRGFKIEQLRTLIELDSAEDRFEQLVAKYSKTHKGKNWKKWPEVWSPPMQQERAAMALEHFARAFLAAKFHEDLDATGDAILGDVRRACRRHEQAVAQLTIARLDARVAALEAKLAGRARPTKAVPRAAQPKSSAKSSRGK